MLLHSLSAQHNLISMHIYKLTNIVNNKIYIGQTTRTIEERFCEHQRHSKYKQKGCRKLYYAIIKYGIQNFKIETIDTASTIEELNQKEEYWIQHFNSVKNGYNLNYGGKNRIPSTETRNKLSEAGKGRSWNENQRRALIKALSVVVYQYDKYGFFIKEFSSSKEASKDIGCDNSDIGKVCKGKRKLAGNFRWSYIKTPYLTDKIERKKHPKRGKNNATNSLKTALLDNNGNILKIYPTAKEAAFQNNCNHSYVVGVCNGKYASAKGLLFKYV